MKEKKSTPVVYIVDDEASIRTGFARLLRASGYRVETFGSAGEFLDHTPRGGTPACLLLDVQLPELNGLDLQRQLATQEYLPIVFISGHGDIPTSVRAMKAGAVDFLTKPVNDNELLNAIESALEQGRREDRERTETVAIRNRIQTLTPREYQVLCRVVAGYLNKQIAADLDISEKTIKIHRGRGVKKMGAHSVAELVRMAEKIGITGPEHASA